jgi:hypothetical protein
LIKKIGEALDNYKFETDGESSDIPLICINDWQSINGRENLENVDLHQKMYSIAEVTEVQQKQIYSESSLSAE